MSARKASPDGQSHDFFQPPPHAIALDRGTHLSGNGEPDTGGAAITAIECLQHKGRGRDSATPGNHQEIGALPQTFHERRSPADSGAQAFATMPPSRGNDLPTSLCGHASAKPMPALAHDLARLIGTFHRFFSGSDP
jgi:hypothetical protein